VFVVFIDPVVFIGCKLCAEELYIVIEELEEHVLEVCAIGLQEVLCDIYVYIVGVIL